MGVEGRKGGGTAGTENQTSQSSVFWKKMGECRRKKGESKVCCFC